MKKTEKLFHDRQSFRFPSKAKKIDKTKMIQWGHSE